jgi:hypothetical protein
MTPSPRRFASVLTLAAIVAGVAAVGTVSSARAQLPTSEERLKILTDPESVKKTLDKDRTRPPLELLLTQVAPFDVLPLVKANHWSTLTLEMVANYEDFSGTLQTSPIPMAGLPREIVYRRDARLPKTQKSRLSVPMFLPAVPRSIDVELTRGEGARPVESWPARLTPLEAHQMLVVFLTKEPSDAYAGWNRFQAIYPNSTDRNTDPQTLEKLRYYRFVMPLKPDRPPLSSHPLTWTTISHIVWDGMPPDNLNPAQQQALLDWLHWGGQLILVGGAGPGIALLKDSFLAPYLPAEPTGENVLLGRVDLQPLAEGYPPPFSTLERGLDDEPAGSEPEPVPSLGRRYRAPAPIEPRADRPVFLAGLKPKAGAIGIPLGESAARLLGVEQRVGRGRVTLLAFNPTDPAIVSWAGFDTFVRRVILRRPEESRLSRASWDGTGYAPPRFGPLSGPDLSWVRYVGRDLGGSLERPPPVADDTVPPSNAPRAVPAMPYQPPESQELKVPEVAVADWNDASLLPRSSRKLLENASGIKVPHAGFVIEVIVAYILLLVPLNWLICRYVFHRREIAWLVVPMLSLGFAVGVERAAAYDLGYDTACDEIDVLEAHGDYPRVLVSRFASLYSNGRTRFSVTYPNEPTALALPLDDGRSLRGEDVSTSAFQSYPVPGLFGYLVQPRSLAFFRAEQMSTLDGSFSLVTDGGPRRVVNGSGLTLRDAVVVDLSGPAEKDRREVFVGDIPPGGTVAVKEASRPSAAAAHAGALDPAPLLQLLRETYEDRPENSGEIRLVAWADRPVGGQTIDPAVDRHRGFTAVVVHLRSGLPPAPDGPIYFAKSAASDPLPPAGPIAPRRGLVLPRGRSMPGGGAGSRRVPGPLTPPPPSNVLTP